MKGLKKNGVLLLLIPIFIFILIPFYWAVVTSLKLEGDVMKFPIKYWPSPATLDNFISTWKNIGFSIFFRNSFIVSIITVAFVLIFSVMIAYGLTRFKFVGKKMFMLILLCTQFIPTAMLLIPLAVFMKNLHLMNTHASLVLTYITFQLPFNAVLMKGFMSGVPVEIEEAARIDGCNQFQVLLQVVLPLLVPGIVAISAFTFIGCWNEFLFSLMFINSNQLFTIPVGLSYMRGQYDINYTALAAGSVISLVPPVLLFGIIQKYLVQGLNAGAVKG